MASIYETRSPSVALTGIQTTPSFQPGQVYDTSRMMLEQSERDLRAFSDFSQTLSNFLVDKAKKRNEEEYEKGLAEVLDGTVSLTPEQSDNFQARVTLLQNAADTDTQVVQDLTNQGQLAAAQQFKAQSKAISGWRAYGRAVGSAKKAASEAQGFFLSWMESDEAIIPTPDRGLIAPRDVSDKPAEIQAALEVGQRRLIEQMGLRSINPVILAEHLAPTLQAVRGQLFANKLSEEVRKRKQTAISDITGNLRSEFNNPNLDVDGMFESFQRNVSLLVNEGDMDRGSASDYATKQILSSISLLPKEIAESMLATLYDVRKIANDPNSITLGAAYAVEFDEAAAAIENRQVRLEQRAEAETERLVERAVGILTRARQDANMPADQLRALRDETIQTLGVLADKGSQRALQARGELLAEPENVDYTLYRQYREGIARGLRPSKEQVDRDHLNGLLTTQMRDEINVYSTSSDRGDFMKQFGKTISDGVKAKLKEAGAISLNPFGTPLKHTFHIEQVTNDLADIAYKAYDAARRKGQPLEDNDLNQLLENQLPRVIGRYFQQNPTTKEWTTRPISKNPAVTPDRIKSTLRGYVPDAGGFNPRTIQLRRYTSGSTRQLNKAEVEDNIQRFQNGQPPTPRAATLARSLPGGMVQLLTDQAQHNGIDPAPIKNSPQAQRLAEFQSIAPRATERLVASTNYLDQALQLRRIAEAQQRAARIREIGKGLGPAVDLKPGARVGMREYLQLALQNGLPPERAILMAAVGMAESTGDSAARLIGGAKPEADPRGLWQINMAGNLGPDRIRRFGLRSAEDLDDPETNARVMSRILQESGLTAWESYTDRRYLQYMPEARRIYSMMKREGFSQARGGRANFSPTNVQSIRIETPGKSFQPGIDLWFADKQFGAVLPGRVKEIRRNYGNYGNMVIVESTDTRTGEPVDVVYAHLDNINVREGDRIAIGSVLGRQGGTGRVVSKDGTIASIDFLAPAPKGSTDMTPYRRWKQLASSIKSRIQSGTF